MKVPAGDIEVDWLRGALQRLDRLLERAVRAANAACQGETANPYKGLCVTPEEVEGLLVREPLRSPWRQVPEGEAQGREAPPAPVVPLQARLGLSDFELDAVLMALAAALDLKYERLFAYLNDDLTKKRPTVDLVLDVLCASGAERLAMHRCFEADGRLFALGAMQFIVTGECDVAPLARQLRLDPVAIRFLLGRRGLEERLARFCVEVSPSWSVADLPVPAAALGLLTGALARARQGAPERIYLQGPDGCGQQACGECMAAGLGTRLLVADLGGMAQGERQAGLRLALLHARLFGQVPLIECDDLGTDGRTKALVTSYPGTILFDGLKSRGDEPGSGVWIDLHLPACAQRRAYWVRSLEPWPPAVGAADLDALATRFELSFPQIHAAVSDAAGTARATDRPLRPADLMDAARRHSSRDLASMAEVIEPGRGWCDLVLPEEAMAQLHDLCDRVRRRHRVLERWGFGRERRGIGVNALFVGGSGTGKTLAAETIAAELGLNLYHIDLATVVSKYIGETEKNLDRIFRAAERSNAVLLFDEADALFGKRSIVRDAHDRYANVEIAYLLQRLETYPGVSVLTTNLSENLDPAFTRRLAFTVHFPFPGPAERLRIWQAVWPPEAPLGPDLQLRWLAERFKLTGGNIRNVALAAACLVVDDSGSITMTQVLKALRREYQKMGKAVSDHELGVPGEALRAMAS
jgi:hypothetical protein